jgi:hypothetical protein
MNTPRRRFLQTVAGAAALGLPYLPLLGELAAFGAEPPPATMRFGPDLEPIVRLIEETPREKCVAVFIDQSRRRSVCQSGVAAAPSGGLGPLLPRPANAR